jgi:hypothetical protein
MTKITIVLEKSTNKIIPFEYSADGEVIITSTHNDIDEDDLIVTNVEPCFINWEDMTLLSQPYKDHMEIHPFNLLYLP